MSEPLKRFYVTMCKYACVEVMAQDKESAIDIANENDLNGCYNGVWHGNGVATFEAEEWDD